MDAVDAAPLSAEKDSSPSDWPIKLFEVSPLKQEKWKNIKALLPAIEGRECLDIGADNGVLSLLLRELGGRWSSCDLSAQTVDSIRDLVRERVYRIDGESTPFENQQFDLIVIIDLLEHIETDREFVNEAYRILKPGGEILINVPNPKDGFLRAFRALIGQTDEHHGHLRPGYTPLELQALVGENFELLEQREYSRLFSVLADTAITAGVGLLTRKKPSKQSSEINKGTVVTGSDMKRYEKSFRLYRRIAPILRWLVNLDHLFSNLHGNMLIMRFRKVSSVAVSGGNHVEALPTPREEVLE